MSGRDSNLVEANRMPREIPSRPLDVHGDLTRQLQGRAELPLAPQKLMEVDTNGVVIHIGIKIEDVAFDRDAVVFVEGWADSDVGDALEGAVEAFESRGADIHAAAGIELIEWIDVDRGDAELASEAAASGHAPVDEMGAAEGQSDGAHGALEDGVAHQRAGDADAADGHVVDAFDPEAMSRARALQFAQISLAARAEGEVAADADLADPKRGDEEFIDEAIGGPMGELVSERHDEQRLDAHVAQNLFLLRQRENLFRSAIRRHDGDRMRMKRDHRGGLLQLLGATNHSAHDGLMTDVHAVEIADRRYAATGKIGLSQRILKDQHCSASSVSAIYEPIV